MIISRWGTMSGSMLLVENLAYWELIYAYAAWKGFREWYRDPVAVLQHLGEACLNKLLVEFESRPIEMFRKREKPTFGRILEKFRDKLTHDYTRLDSIRRSRIDAVHYSKIPCISDIQRLLIIGTEFVTRGIFLTSKEVIDYGDKNLVDREIPLRYFDRDINSLLKTGLAHKTLISPNDKEISIAKNIMVNIYKNFKPLHGDIVVLNPLIYLVYTGRRAVEITDSFVGSRILKGQFNKVRLIYKQSLIFYGIREYNIQNLFELVEFLVNYDEWTKILPHIPHIESLMLEAASYLATDIIKSLCSKIMENSRYSEYIFILVDFLGRTIPDYVFETSKLSGYLIDPQDRPNIKFSSFVSSKKITNDVIKPIMGVRKKLPTHKTNSIKSKELDEKLRKLREATLVRPLLTSKVFRIFQEHQ